MVCYHNGGKNYDVIETTKLKLQASLWLICTANINLQELDFLVLVNRPSHFANIAIWNFLWGGCLGTKTGQSSMLVLCSFLISLDRLVPLRWEKIEADNETEDYILQFFTAENKSWMEYLSEIWGTFCIPHTSSHAWKIWLKMAILGILGIWLFNA